MRVILLALLLSACATAPQTIEPPTDKKTSIVIDERLLQPCQPFTDIVDNPQPSDAVEQHKKDALIHRQCMDDHSALIKVVRDAFGL